MQGWTLGAVTGALASVFVLHAFVIVPLVRRQLASAQDSAKPTWAAAVLLFETSQLVSLAALVSAGLTWGILWFVTLGSGASSVSVALAIDRIQATIDLIGRAKLVFWLWAFALATAALYFWIARARQAQFTKARAALFQEKFNRLVEEFNAGSLPALEPTGEMKALIERLGALDIRMQETVEHFKAAESDDQRSNLASMLQEFEQQRRTLFNNLVTLDLGRRVEIPPYDPDLIGLPPPACTLWQKVGRVFVSRGMFRQLSLGQRALLLLNVLLVVPSLLTLTGDSLAANLEARITTLDQLRVGLVAQEAEARFEAALHVPLPPANAADTADDSEYTTAAYAHAHAFENAIARNLEARYPSPRISATAPSRNAQIVLREHNTRRRILAAVAERANDASSRSLRPDAPPPERAVHGALAASHQPDQVPLDQLAHRAAVMASDPTPRGITPAGESLAQEIIARGRQDAGFRQRVVASFRAAGASFFEAARPSLLRGVLLAGALGGSTETAVLSEVFAEPARVAAETVEPALRARAYQSYSRTYLATLIETGQAQTAVRAVEAMPDNHLLRTEVTFVRDTLASRIRPDSAIIGELERFPPGLVEVHDGVTNTAARDAMLRRFYEGEAARRNIELPTARLAALVNESPASANFERYFPSDLSSSGGGSGGGGVGGGGGGGVGGGGGGVREGGRAGPSPTATRTSAIRARSFVQLRGFARVGGVLIGREPEPGSPLDVRDIQWTLKGTNLTLTLTDASKNKVTVGPVRASVAHLALGYTADARPLTVTMTKADPLRELRILLHPVLVDTPLGCRAIEIDRFVDEATSQSRIRSFATALVEIQRSLYAAGRIALIKAVFNSEDARALVGREEEIAEVAGSNESKGVFERIMSNSSLLTDPEVSPLTIKTGYYHPRVVKLVDTCVKPNSTYPMFRQCLTREAQNIVRTQHDLKAKEKINWTAPTPTFQPWSGVREKSYRLDPRFEFAGVGHTRDDPPDPFELIIQVSFTSPPYAGREKPWYEDRDNEDDANDPAPWLFSDSALNITSSVLDLIRTNNIKADVFSGMREFAWLQRLFRAGLNGGLGSSFPIERLGELSEKTASVVERQRTLRWNVRPPGELAFLFQLLKGRATFDAKGRQDADVCLRSVGIVPTANDASNDDAIERAVVSARRTLDTMSDDDWDKSCRFKVASLPQEFVEYSERTSDLRRLRASLGVRDDELLIQSDAQCRPL